MRRWTVGVLALAALLGLAGCAALRPGGTLATGAVAAATVKLPGPDVGACYTRPDMGYTGTNPDALEPDLVKRVDCATRHMSETVFVGEFTGADGERADRPADGSTPMKRAFAQCVRGARVYLGADWRTGRLALRFHPPTGKLWGLGYRYFRCDVSEVVDSRQTLVVRTGSVRHGLAGKRPLATTCATVKQTSDGKDIDGLVMVACTRAHDAEFAGYTLGPAVPWPATDKEYQKYGSVGCTKTVAAYLGDSPGAYEADPRFTWIYHGPSKDGWEVGDRSYQCWVFMENGKIHASVKGIGSHPLPH
jgi:hypothetical protein